MEPISSLSRPYLYSWISGAAGTEPVSIAFTVPGVEPVEQDWYPASWARVSAGGAEARVLVGPDGGIPLAGGTYQMWVRVSAPPEQPLLPSGLVTVI